MGGDHQWFEARIRDVVYNFRPDSGVSDEYCRGLLVGLYAGIEACKKDVDPLVEIVYNLPDNPEKYRKDKIADVFGDDGGGFDKAIKTAKRRRIRRLKKALRDHDKSVEGAFDDPIMKASGCSEEFRHDFDVKEREILCELADVARDFDKQTFLFACHHLEKWMP